MGKRATAMLRDKIDQLPLPAADRDRIALEYHLALATLRAGVGDCHVLSILTGVLVTVHYLLMAGIEASNGHRDAFAAAQTALNTCDIPAACAARWVVSSADIEALAALLSLHDRQLARASRHSVMQAVAQREAYWARQAGTHAEAARKVA
jgi:hypothetical protein